MNWHNIGLSLILTGKTDNGEAFLKLFLKDYVSLTHESVNATCQKCIKSYFDKYIKLTTMSENKSNYKLHPKREGLQLKFGSNIHVTNNNLTDEYAEILIARYKELKPDFELSYLFSEYPKEQIEVEAEIVKPKRKRRQKKAD